MRKMQQEDKDIAEFLAYREVNEEKPKYGEIATRSPEFKTYWAQWERLQLEEGTLYRLPKEGSTGLEGRRFVAPNAIRVEVFKALHHGSLGGHQGVNKTHALVKARYYWPQMGRDVRQWCARCHICGETKPMTLRTKSRLIQTKVGAPFEKTAIDLMGPFAETKNGNVYIVVGSGGGYPRQGVSDGGRHSLSPMDH